MELGDVLTMTMSKLACQLSEQCQSLNAELMRERRMCHEIVARRLHRCEASCRTPAWKRPLSCPSWAWSFTRARAAAAGFQNAGNGYRAGSNGHLRSTRERADSGGDGVREFKAELEGIERKLQSQEDIFVNRSLAVCECFFAVRFEDHSDVLEKKLSARNSRSRLT